MAELKVCTVARCQRPARWTVTITGHPNGPASLVREYCTEHAREKASTLWEESPVQYRVMVEGPW